MYRIHVAAEKAGVSAQLLRAWERRYGLLAPSRTDSGYRVYSDDDVSILRGAKVLIDEGGSIAEIARLPHEQLRRAAVRQPSARIGVPAGSWQETALAAVSRFDGATLERLILTATGMGTSTDSCDRVLMPLLVAIGERWEKGSLDVAAEHFGSAIIRRHLHELVETEARRNRGAPAIVCACPEGDLHEGGLLAFAVHATALGWTVVYLGPNTPTADIIATAERTEAGGVALSLTSPLPSTARRKLVQALVGWKGKSASRRVWIGGRGAAPHVKDLAGANLGFLPDASVLDQRAKRSP
jgi:DNA-binding transcriptional MerR regulator/methylmalonyl-CoA mutase cobalamin-binding subunit